MKKLTFSIFLLLFFLFVQCNESEKIVEPQNSAPAKAFNPVPQDSSTNQDNSLILSWECNDEDSDTLLYDVYFGNSQNPPLYMESLRENNIQIDSLNYDTTYYWKITVEDGVGNITEGDIWSFSTVQEPYLHDYFPINGSLVNYNGLTLRWDLSDYSNSQFSYELYLGEVGSNLELIANLINKSYQPQNLKESTDYVWKIIARNEYGYEIESDVLRFTTLNWEGYNGWEDYELNPILEPLGTDKDRYGVYTPTIYKDENKYCMWFEGRDGTHSEHGYIYLATSSDGLNWERVSNEPVISPSPQEWDSYRVRTGPVIKEDGMYKMYYTGYNNDAGEWKIGLAASYDGINWTKHQHWVYSGTWSNDYRVVATDIKKINGKYYLYYFGQPGNRPLSDPEWLMKVAVSEDGTNWTPIDENPILPVEENWEFNRTMYGNSILEGSIYRMIYLAGDSEKEAFGWAYSYDGLSWQKTQTNPFLNRSNVNLNLQRAIMPFIIKTENEYRIYYAGLKQDDTYVLCVLRKRFQ